MENKFWMKTVGALIGAIWLYTLAGIAGSIAGAVNSLLEPGGVMGMMASMMGEGEGSSPIGMGDVIEGLFAVLVLAGYLLFYTSLSDFMRLQRSEADREAVRKVRTAYILMLVAVLVDFIPFVGWLAALILMIVAYVKMLGGYKSLKTSATFPEGARPGAALLHTSTIWLLVAYILGCIPLVGNVIAGIITFVVFFTVLAGWGRIRRGAPLLTEIEAERLEMETGAAFAWSSGERARKFGAALLVFAALPLLSSLVFAAFRSGLVDDITCEYETADGYRTIFVLQMAWYIVSQAVTIAVCAWLFVTRGFNLGVLSKVGIGVSLLMQVLFAAVYFLAIFDLFPREYYSLVYSVVGVLNMVGIVLFIWGSFASTGIKIVYTFGAVLLESMGLFLWRLLNNHYTEHWPDMEAMERYEMVGRINSSITLGVQCVFFAALLIAVVLWWQKVRTSETLPAAGE